MTVLKDGKRLEGLVTVDGHIPSPPVGSITSDDVINNSTVPGATVTDALDNLLPGAPSFIIEGSQVFVANVFSVIHTYPMTSAEFQSVTIFNSSFRRGTGGNVRSTQFRLWGQIKRPTGLGALVTPLTFGAQGDTSGTFSLVANGNNVEFQVKFVTGATYFYYVPVYLIGGVEP